MELNVGQGPNPARPGELTNFASRGITHVGLGFGTEVRAGRSATLAFGARSQLNLDAATKADGTARVSAPATLRRHTPVSPGNEEDETTETPSSYDLEV